MLRTSLFIFVVAFSFNISARAEGNIVQACHVRFLCPGSILERMVKLQGFDSLSCTGQDQLSNITSQLTASAQCGTSKQTGQAIAPTGIRRVFAIVAPPLDLNLVDKSHVECIKFTRCFPGVGSDWRDPISYSWIAPNGECTATESHSALTRHASNTCKALTGNQNATDQGSSFDHYLRGPFEALLPSKGTSNNVANAGAAAGSDGGAVTH